MERRAQISILFTDEELYDNFITYKKQEKTLKPLVLKLLSAYYYNDEVRALVDGETGEDEVASAQEKAMGYFEQCRQSLALMSVYAEGLEDLTDDSLDKFGEFADNVATKTGGEASTTTEFGKSIPQLEMKNVTNNTEMPVNENVQDNGIKSKEYIDLEKRIDYLTSLVLSLTQSDVKGVSEKQENVNTAEEQVKNETFEEKDKVVTSEEKHEELSETTVEENASKDMDIAEVTESEKKEPVEEVDSGFDDLLASAGITF